MFSNLYGRRLTMTITAATIAATDKIGQQPMISCHGLIAPMDRSLIHGSHYRGFRRIDSAIQK